MAKTTRLDAQKLLADVPEQFVFWAHDGGIIRNMRELADALGSMSDETYYYHANDFKKDFGNWVRDIIGDAKLARDLDKAPSRIEAARTAAKRVSFLASKA